MNNSIDFIKEHLEQIKSELRDGGPPVDYDLLAAFCMDVLKEPDTRLVVEQIVTWKAWYAGWMEVNQLEGEYQTFLETADNRNTAPGNLKENSSNAPALNFRSLAIAVCILLMVTAALLFLLPREKNGFADSDRQVALTDNGIKGLESFSPQWQQKAETNLRNGLPRLQMLEDLENLAGPDSKGTFTLLLSPKFTLVREQTPTFKWKRLSESSTVKQVLVFPINRPDSIASEPTSPNSTIHRLQYKLPRGKIYHWKLLLTIDADQLVSPGEGHQKMVFKVMDDATERRIQEEEKELVDSPFLLFLLYYDAGLLMDADNQLKLLERGSPNSAELQQFRKTLDSLLK